MKYEDLNVGVKAPYKDCKQFFGKELTFKELVYEPCTEKLLILMLCTVNGIEEDDDIYVGQISRVVDCEEGYEEYADIILDIPGWDQKPISIDSDDMEYPELGEDDDPEVVTNCYVRVWRIKKPLTTLEHLAIGASVYSKCKRNMIDTTEDLLEAFRTGAIKRIFNRTAINAIKTVLTNAKIEVPEEEQKQETAIVAAQPAELDPVEQAMQLHRRIKADWQIIGDSFWDMGVALKEMRDGKHYKALLYANFESYCEQEFGLSRPQAYRYISIAENMTKENVSSMRQIGLTKLALLASVTEEQREEIAQTVDLESTTVRELKAQVEAMKADAANKDKLLMQARESSQKSYEEVQERQEVINDLKARLKERTEQMNDMQAQITKLESRPVEIAVQDNSAELERIRKEYEAKLAEQDKAMQKLEDELNQRDDNDHFLRLDINYREARVKVQTLCTMVANLNDGKEKETLKQNIRNIIHDIEQRIGKE